MDDDCLFLNVWSPREGHGLPVMVWIHGGGYFVGSGSSPNCAGTQLAGNGPAVVVTLNFRLGYRGYLDLSTLPGAEGRFDTNLGIRDQIAALTWVRDNIASFGGDPDNVTLFGQSAGGASVCCLLASPPAVGLFHAAIAQSPPAESVFDRDSAATVTRNFLDLVGKPDADFDALLASDPSVLLEASAQLVQAMTDVFPGHHAFQPVIDADVLPERPASAITAGHGSHVPLLIGSNEDEGSLFVHPPMPPLIPARKPHSRLFLRQSHPDAEDAVLAAYEGHGRFAMEMSIGGDGMVTIPAVRVAESLCTRTRVYVYRFRWTNSALRAKRLGTPHSLDVPFVFGNFQESGLVNLESDDSGEIRQLSQTVQTAWLGFARDHVPDVKSTVWPAYDMRDRKVMVIDRDLTVERDPDAPQRRSWGPDPSRTGGGGFPKDRGSVPPVLLLPGGAEACDGFFPGLPEGLAGEPGSPVITYDRPGTGDSTTAGTLAQAASHLNSLIDDLGQGPVVLVGQSLGGAVAALLARDHPENVAGLVLLDPTPINDLRMCARVERTLRTLEAVASVPVLHRLLSSILRGTVHRTMRHHQLRPDCATALERTLGLDIPKLARAVRGITELSAGFRESDLPRLPAVVVTADRKPNNTVRRAHTRLAAALGAPLVCWPGATHNVHLDHPTETLSTVRELLTRIHATA